MQTIISKNLNHALIDVIKAVKTNGYRVEVRDGQNTLEVTPLVVQIENPRQRCLVNPERKNNIFATIAETMWVLAGRSDIEWLSNYLPRAKDFSDDGSTWRAGYGKRLRGWNGIDQMREVYKILKADPSSRRAVMSIFDPDRDYIDSKDIPCNNWLHFMIREGKLNLDVAVRSNDAIWGFSAINVFEWSVLLEAMAYWLEVKPGRLSFFVSSMHIYERHEERADNILQADFQDIYDQKPEIYDFHTTFEQFDKVVEDWFLLESKIRTGTVSEHQLRAFPDPLLRGYLQMLCVYWALKNHDDDAILSYKLAALSGSDLELAALEYIRRQRPDFMRLSVRNHTKAGDSPKIILVEGADQTGKTTLINELISQLGESNCAYFHNVLYDDFQTAHAAVLSIVKNIRGKPYVLVDRWHLSHVVYGEVFGNSQYDESHPLFADIDSYVDRIVICAVPDYKFRDDIRRESLVDAEKQCLVNQLFYSYQKRSTDGRSVLYNYRKHLTPEKLKKFANNFIQSLGSG